MAIKSMENGILINYMAAERWNKQVVTVCGGNSKIVNWKDMEQSRVVLETDTSGNG